MTRKTKERRMLHRLCEIEIMGLNGMSGSADPGFLRATAYRSSRRREERPSEERARGERGREPERRGASERGGEGRQMN